MDEKESDGWTYSYHFTCTDYPGPKNDVIGPRDLDLEALEIRSINSAEYFEIEIEICIIQFFICLMLNFVCHPVSCFLS